MSNELPVVVAIAAATILGATPYLYASIGEMFAQRSGVLNLGVDGIMLVGAFFAFYGTLMTGSLLVGVVAAVLAGIAMGLLMAVVSVTLKAEQGISGIGLSLFGLGLSSLLFKVLVGTPKYVDGFQPIRIPVLADIPGLGDVLFSQSLPVYAAFLLVPVSWYALERTTWGLKVRAAGQNPAAADSLGVSVNRIRYACVCLGAAMAGLAGASLAIAINTTFQENLTAGAGYIAVALVYFGGWRPVGVMLGALLFSGVTAIQLHMQVLGVAIPAELANMLPYALTIVVLMFPFNRGRQPAALNRPFERGES
jgi:general nucleoside transport system permease protein